MEGVTEEDTPKKAQTPLAGSTSSDNEAMEDVGTPDTSKQGERLATVDENVAMQDAVDMGVAAAQKGSGAATVRREEFRKRNREEDGKENPSAKVKTSHEDGYATEASMKSCTTVPRGNTHQGPDQQQLAYRESVEDASVASMRDDDASITSRNTWKSMASLLSHQKQLTDRREKDKEKYASMTREERRAYNAKRRDKYHRQSMESRQKQRQRARNQYHQGSVMSEAESIARKERRDKMQQEQMRSKQAVKAATDG